MKATVGALFQAFQLVESESYQAAEKITEGGTVEDFREIRALHAVLYKALRDCNSEVELYPELNCLVIPFLKKYNLEIISE